MKIYNFYDTNIYGDQNDNYNIEGKDYERLIDFCCKYCDFVSFEMTGEDIQLFETLGKYRVCTPVSPSNDASQLYKPRSTARFYRICPDVNALLKKNVKSIFEWINGWGYKNPENPAFYRKDGSVFFCSEIHDGWCTILPNDDEDVSDIVSDSNWLLEDHVGFKYEFTHWEYPSENEEYEAQPEAHSSCGKKMRILKKFDSLKEKYKNDFVVRVNGTELYGTDKGLTTFARHIFFKPLTDKLIYKYLSSRFEHTFPEEYIKLLKYTNGLNLFNIQIRTQDFRWTQSMLTIYGLPRKDPFKRPLDEEEPLDMRTENMARHKSIPRTLFKCGSYLYENDIKNGIDIFIDTASGHIYSYKKRTDIKLHQWNNLDECLCGLLELLKDTPIEIELGNTGDDSVCCDDVNTTRY